MMLTKNGVSIAEQERFFNLMFDGACYLLKKSAEAFDLPWRYMISALDFEIIH